MFFFHQVQCCILFFFFEWFSHATVVRHRKLIVSLHTRDERIATKTVLSLYFKMHEIVACSRWKLGGNDIKRNENKSSQKPYKLLILQNFAFLSWQHKKNFIFLFVRTMWNTAYSTYKLNTQRNILFQHIFFSFFFVRLRKFEYRRFKKIVTEIFNTKCRNSGFGRNFEKTLLF